MRIMNFLRSFLGVNQPIVPVNNDDDSIIIRNSPVSEQLSSSIPPVDASAYIISPPYAAVSNEAPITYIQNANDINIGVTLYESYSKKYISNPFSFGTATPSYIKNSLSLYLPGIDISFKNNKDDMEKGKYYLVAAKIIGKYQTGNDILVLHCDENNPLTLFAKLVFPYKKSKNINKPESIIPPQFPIVFNQSNEHELNDSGLDSSGAFTLLDFSIINPSDLS